MSSYNLSSKQVRLLSRIRNGIKSKLGIDIPLSNEESIQEIIKHARQSEDINLLSYLHEFEELNVPVPATKAEIKKQKIYRGQVVEETQSAAKEPSPIESYKDTGKTDYIVYRGQRVPRN